MFGRISNIDTLIRFPNIPNKLEPNNGVFGSCSSRTELFRTYACSVLQLSNKPNKLEPALFGKPSLYDGPVTLSLVDIYLWMNQSATKIVVYNMVIDLCLTLLLVLITLILDDHMKLHRSIFLPNILSLFLIMCQEIVWILHVLRVMIVIEIVIYIVCDISSWS